LHLGPHCENAIRCGFSVVLGITVFSVPAVALPLRDLTYGRGLQHDLSQDHANGLAVDRVPIRRSWPDSRQLGMVIHGMPYTV